MQRRETQAKDMKSSGVAVDSGAAAKEKCAGRRDAEEK